MIGKFILRHLRPPQTRDPDALIGGIEFNREVARERLRAVRRAIPFCVVTIDLAIEQSERRRRIKRSEQRSSEQKLRDILRYRVRSTDYKAQLGPQRFAVLLVDTPEMGGRAALDRIESLCESRGLQALLTLKVHDPDGFHSNDNGQDVRSNLTDFGGRRRNDVSDSFDSTEIPWSPVDYGSSESDGVACVASPPRTLRSEQTAETRLAGRRCQTSVQWSLNDENVCRSKIRRRWNKRMLDVGGAAVGLVVLSPIFLVVAIAIKLTSSGPVFFRQIREGKGGRPFVILKFRTMVVDAEQQQDELKSASHRDGPAFKIKNDPRVTAVGKFLRKTCIDELPQLINVLRGEMSLVGPRPLPWHESQACDRWHRRRLDVKPGMTCHWQIDKTAATTFDDWMRLDLQYVDRSSTWQDLRLIARTTVVPMTGRGSD
ncbi:sugar transferase [Roseiconus lacunae]|uniref:sugar transferase n=1 Tax=Roseiconus lacunae TaxID=2605694 RepID=UPI001F1A31D0|nr:sugar transferase [Roseiconus lacunae]